ncbi:MAG: hypothetical protein GX330_06490 [Bacteroidales bacterium]|nr:hypothetical protein [Bacteroidales bacterium]
MNFNKQHRIVLFIDFVLVSIVFISCHFIMSAKSGWFWFGAILIWILIGFIFQKFSYRKQKSFWQVLACILFINGISLLVLFFFANYIGLTLFWSWKYMLLVLALTLMEIFLLYEYLRFVKRKNLYEIDTQELEPYHGQAKIKLKDVLDEVTPRIKEVFDSLKKDPSISQREWYNANKDSFGSDFVLFSSDDILSMFGTSTKEHRFICDVSKLNDVRYINQYFIKINELLPFGGVFIACCETSKTRKRRYLKSYFTPLNYVLYTFDFIWHRIAPKLHSTRKLYFAVTKGKHRVFPYPEILGRLYSCGFEIATESYTRNLYYFAVVKTNLPYESSNPTYAPFIKLKRVGKNGKLIGIYKFRTMHAYSEYLQPYVYQKYKLKKGGKFAYDFRVSNWGRFLRKFWLDELPMLFNLFKGDIKLVGVRPLSQHYFSLYTPEMQALRIQVKPGLLPPFYSGEKPQTLDEVQENEKQYIEAYLKHPFRTDWKYFWKIMYMIIFKRKRSE